MRHYYQLQKDAPVLYRYDILLSIDEAIDDIIADQFKDDTIEYLEWAIGDQNILGEASWRQSLVRTAAPFAVAAASLMAPTSNARAAQPEQPTKLSQLDKAQTKSANHTSILRSIYELAKQSFDGGERADAVIFSSQLQKWAPEYYGKGAEYYINYVDLAGMPDDAYEQFLNQLEYNIQQRERADAKHHTRQWTDSAGNTFEARFLRFDVQGDYQGHNGWVWMEKDGKQVRLPFRFLSQQSQREIINSYR